MKNMKKNTARSKSTRNKIEQYLKKRATEYERKWQSEIENNGMKRVSSQIARFLLPAIYVERLTQVVRGVFFAACPCVQAGFCFVTLIKVCFASLSSKVTLGSSVRLPPSRRLTAVTNFCTGCCYVRALLYLLLHCISDAIFCNEPLASCKPKQLDYKNSSLLIHVCFPKLGQNRDKGD
ncbi:MAG: hypothetical protein ACLS8R_06925 [Anaeromassilibacillus sp.]